MARVLIGLGSNISPELNLSQAACALRQEFGRVAFSSVYRSAAVGMEGEDFLNACCLLNSELAMQEIRLRLKALEDAQGRDRSKGSWRPRTLDLDILMYDDQVTDNELHRHAHAFVPAAELVDCDLPEDEQGLLSKVALNL
jgi:2-amino-4-hydroxy-6-hydroxymethyldihydropteridine diphosphokinase